MAIVVRPIKGTFVGEVDPIDLRYVDDGALAELKASWNRYQILVFHGLKMDNPFSGGRQTPEPCCFLIN